MQNRASVEEAQDMDQSMNAVAATIIQSFARSLACQKDVRQTRMLMRLIEIARLNLAAITIQSVFCSWICQKELVDRRIIKIVLNY